MQLKHPLSGENLVIREVINSILDTAQLDVLQAINDISLPADQNDIATRADVSNKTAKAHLSTLRNRGLVKSYRNQFEPTAGGKLLLEEVQDCLRTISRGNLTELTRSENSLPILAELRDKYQETEEIQQRLSTSPSKQTTKRQLKWFADNELGWAKENLSTYRITDAGEEVLLAYDNLSTAVEQTIEKAEWFQRLPLEDATVPVQALTDAVVITSDSASPSNVLSAAYRLCDLRVSEFRGFCSIYNPLLFYAYKIMLDFGVEAEAILDWDSYIKADQDPKTKFAAHSLYEHYQPFYLEDSHTLGIGIYDDRKVAVGAYNEHGEGKHIAMIVSSNPKIVEWTNDLYNSYREIANHSEENPPDINGGFDGREW
jgi:predicted transcriptional regulator